MKICERLLLKRSILVQEPKFFYFVKPLNNNVNKKKKNTCENLTSEVMWHKNCRRWALILTYRHADLIRNPHTTKHFKNLYLSFNCYCSHPISLLKMIYKIWWWKRCPSSLNMPKGTFTQIIKWHINRNRNTSNSFPQINDALRFCLQAEKAMKTNFCVHFDSETRNINKVEKLCRGETFVNFENFDTFCESFSTRNSIKRLLVFWGFFCNLKCIILDNALGLTALPE